MKLKLNKKEKPAKPAKVVNPDDFVSQADYLKRLRFWLVLLLGAFLFVTVALIINYLVFIPWKNKQWNAANPTEPQLAETFAWTSSTIFAFVVVIILLVLSVGYSVAYFVITLKTKYNDPNQNKYAIASAGFLANFFDTIGIGSFGITTAALKLTKQVKDDSKLPGTMNVALGIGALCESALFVSSIEVETWTLVLLVGATIIGAFVGSIFVSKIKDPTIIKLVMGVVLFVAAILMILTHPDVQVINTTNIGDKKSLMDQWWRILIGIIIFFFLGMIQTFGVGLYAPSMATLSFLGLDQSVVFPIMAVGSAVCMLPAAIMFIKNRNFMQLTANAIAVFSPIGVVVAYLLVFVGLQMGAGMDEATFNSVLKWMAIVVIFYVSFTMLYEYYKIKSKQTKQKASQQVEPKK